jgi:hypothetical protein
MKGVHPISHYHMS